MAISWFPLLLPAQTFGYRCPPLGWQYLAYGGVDKSRVLPDEFSPGPLHVLGGTAIWVVVCSLWSAAPAARWAALSASAAECMNAAFSLCLVDFNFGCSCTSSLRERGGGREAGEERGGGERGGGRERRGKREGGRRREKGGREGPKKEREEERD